jgi:2-deoxy-D-gluconate 3-dehydrogenase
LDLFNIEGNKAIVTGGASGLAQGMAEGLMQAGAEVVIFDISPKLPDVVEEFRAQGYKAHGLIVNIGDREQVRKTFQEALDILGGRLDIMIPAAGIQRRNKCEEFSMEDWDAVINIDLSSVFLMDQLAGQVMLRQKYGKIVNIASMLSFFGGYTVPAYAASKGGVAQITKALSNEWASQGVNVNAIAPGYMATKMNEGLLKDAKRNESITSRIPARRWGTPDDLKGVIIFLSSHASDYLSGAVIPVDGGYLGF